MMLKAIEALQVHLYEKSAELISFDDKFSQSAVFKQLNERQIALIRHAFSHHGYHYTIAEHKSSNRVTYQTARTDLMQLHELDFLQQKKQGRAFIYLLRADVKTLLAE